MYGYCTHLYVLAGCVLCITSGFFWGGFFFEEKVTYSVYRCVLFVNSPCHQLVRKKYIFYFSFYLFL